MGLVTASLTVLSARSVTWIASLLSSAIVVKGRCTVKYCHAEEFFLFLLARFLANSGPLFCSSRWLHANCDNMKTEDEAERMSDLGYNCLFCRPLTGAPSPRPPSPEPQTPASIASPALVPVKEEKTYSVDGIYLSENGLALVKELTMETPSTLTPAQKAAFAARQARNRQMKIKQTHPQMSQLLSNAPPLSGTDIELCLYSIRW